tara:strand:+ start:4420 stop:5067 length:648 start_codon:yes stop_codon:yes gene_type:complete
MASKTLLVPNKLSDITIGQYQKFAKISTDKVDKDFLEKKMIEIFCHVELKDVNNIKYSSIKKVVNILNKMFEVKPKLISTFKMNDKEYGMIPKIDDITFGEYVDIDSTISDWDSVDKAMSVLYRPIKYKKGKRYLIEDYDSDNENYMDKMPLDVALGALFFLSNLHSELTSHILNFSREKLMKLTPRQKEHLQRIGVGTPAYTHCLARILADLKK